MKYLESFDLFGGGEYEKMTRGRFIDEKNKIIANILKNKGVQDSEIKKALDELNRKLKN
jgi:hypothetical protein